MADFTSDANRDRGFKPQALGLSTTALILLRDLIVENTGQYFDDQKLDILADKITDLVATNGVPTILDYYYLLKYDKTTDEHWLRLLDKLAVPETYFWRQPDQIITLVNDVVPQFIARHPGRTLRIWSAACCSGEEPLSIAMALDQAGLFQHLDIEIIGTDASPAVLDRARRGIYGERSMRVIPDHLRDRYFTRSERGWEIDRAIHQRVQFGRVNLAVADEVLACASAHVTFCRNVLIYFSDEAIRAFAATLARAIPDDGILFLGASESLIRLATAFQMIEIGSSFAYTPISSTEGFDARLPLGRATINKPARYPSRTEV